MPATAVTTHPRPTKMRVHKAGQKRGLTPALKKKLAPMHAADHGINAVLAAAGHNFGRILAWLRILLAWILYTPGASKMLQAA
jgi:hypothetical protein